MKLNKNIKNAKSYGQSKIVIFCKKFNITKKSNTLLAFKKITELFNVSGKVAIVTGGSRGIGEMIAAGFLANGVKVYITARKEAALIEKAKELSEMYEADCIPVPCDLSTMEGIDSFANYMQSNEESIDFLINNAGA